MIQTIHDDADLCSLVVDAQVASDHARRELLEGEVITRCRPLAWGIAHRYANRGAELDDLRAVADAAVLGAIRRYEPGRGSFLGYASVTVLGEIKKYFRDSCWTIRPTRSVQELQARLSAATIHLQHMDGAASVATLAEHLGVSPAEVQEAAAARSCFTPTSLDAPVPGHDTAGGLDVAVEDRGFVLAEERLATAGACADLSLQERELLRLRFFEDLTQRQIADRLGKTQVQVSRELRRVLTRLRLAIDDMDVEQTAKAG
ncbi:sigma-70 family RNA polymerase sigma factor [Aeromicrobium sp. SMF47]|uniref:sigma-70 family RNA polymerase sigma factor n=1 Tax=Aeromicrobium yanjiei TaxID=2662028 RepID=UPI00129E24DF|nr:sigma-70 family RNA polymerase sigma factor [Aeromicrobium yanjiei]MRJ76161.1 sigma-70 family RNA polymerase sigma factor [Aeromicrobium yanjiei]